MKRKLTATLVAMLLVAGCAGIDKRVAPDAPAGASDAWAFLSELDRLVDRHGVRDAGRFPIPGYPYLRTDRFLGAMRGRLDTPERQRHWVGRMQQADLEARRREIGNLPPEALAELSEWVATLTAAAAVDRTVQASELLLEADLLQEGYYERVARAASVPDEYSTPMRVFLLYPIAAFPVSMATTRVYEKYRAWHRTPPEELPITGVLTRFAPLDTYRPLDPTALDRFFSQAGRDAFDLPKWTPGEVAHLAEMFAPVISQDVAEDYDRFGAVGWHEGRVTIAYEDPVMYYYLSYAFLQGEPVVQLNYALWYTARAGKNAPAIERGPLDGLTVRLTFDRNGAVVMADVMNTCGCYHFFVPDRDRVAEVIIKAYDFEPLVPAWLPKGFPRKRLDLRVNSGWHQVQQVDAAGRDSDPAIAYSLEPYGVLESLPAGNGTRASVFSPEGIMKHSSRIEPYVFFSMGIPKVGYMRQRGHHAIKLVGREHFTNPYLLDSNFLFNRN